MESTHKVSKIKYVVLVLLATIVIVLSLYCSFNNEHKVIMSNLGCGVIASTIVAWLIEAINVKEKNEIYYRLYHTVYAEIKCSLFYYLSLSATISNQYGEEGLKDKEYTWTEWYEKWWKSFSQKSESYKREGINQILELLQCNIKPVIKSCKEIEDKHYYLGINGLIDDDIYCTIDEIHEIANSIVGIDRLSDSERSNHPVTRKAQEFLNCHEELKNVFDDCKWNDSDIKLINTTTFKEENYWEKVIKEASYVANKEVE